MTTQSATREALLHEYGGFYGAEGFAVAFTAGAKGDDAKRVLTRDWQHTRRLVDAEFGAALVANRGLTHNVALVLRPSNLLSVEADSEEDLAQVEALGLPATLTVQSSAPCKRHWHFRPAPEIEQMPAVCFRFESGRVTADASRYLLAPPSQHPTGATYQFLPGLGPGEVEIATFPANLYALLLDRARQNSRATREAVGADPTAKFTAGQRGDAIFRYACQQRRWTADRDEILELAQLYNARHCEPPIGRDRVATQVDGAMKMPGGQELAKATNLLPAVAAGQTPVTLDQVVATFGKSMYLPDPTPLYVALAVVVANRMPEGDPVWVVFVAGSSRGKTEILLALDGLDGVRVVGKLTAAALLSGTGRKDRAKHATGGVLREIGDEGVVVIKDMGVLLAMQRDSRAEVLQMLRDAHDGRVTRDVGIDGGVKHEWQGRLGLIGAATSALDRAHGVLASLGERWLTLRLPPGGEEEMVKQVLRTTNTGEMRAELRQVMHSFLEPRGPVAMRPVTTEEEELIVALSSLTCLARSPVERDSYSREIVLVHDSEGPGRIARQLHKLLVALEAIGLDAEATKRTIVRVGIDSIPSPRREALMLLLEGGEDTTSEIAQKLDLPTGTTERALYELNAHGLLHRGKAGSTDNSANVWKPTGDALTHWKVIQPHRPVVVEQEG